MKNKNEILLSKMIQYCNEIEDTKKYFGIDEKLFFKNSIFRNSCNMCVLQIGELVANLDDDIKAKYSNIPWKEIKGIRNIFAHSYHNINYKNVWKTLVSDIPVLKKEIEKILEQEINKEQENEKEPEEIKKYIDSQKKSR